MNNHLEKVWLTIDIGGTRLKYGVFNQQGEIIEKHSRATQSDSLAAFLADLYAGIDSLAYRFSGIGISCPGAIDPLNQVIYEGGALRFLHGVRLGELLNARYKLPVAIENDGKIVACAEQYGGSLQGVADGVAITLGTGVGGGIILNHQLRSGNHFRAGELSFIVSRFTAGDVRWAGQLASAVNTIKAINQVKDHADLTDGETALRYVNDGDPQARAIFDDFCREVARLLFNLHSTLDVQKIVIGGGISAQPVLLERVRHHFAQLVAESRQFGDFPFPEIDRCHYQNDAALYGAFFKLTRQVDPALTASQAAG